MGDIYEETDVTLNRHDMIDIFGILTLLVDKHRQFLHRI